jgi:membrane protein DedA with SNARE-associated domain
MIDLITNLMTLNLYIVVFILIFIENIFPPIPSELVLAYAGSLIIVTNSNIYLLIITTTLSSLISSLLFYFIGSKITLDTVLSLNKKLKNFGFKPHDIKNSYAKFSKNGSLFVFVSRLIPVMRTLVSLPAGSVKMPLKQFIFYTFLGSLIWNSALIFTEQITTLTKYMSTYQNVILIIILIYIAYKLIKKHQN